MRAVLPLTFLTLIASAFACALPGNPATPATSSSAPDFSEAVDPATEPVRVSLTTDAARSVSAEIPVEGGSLTATAADGTTFTLEIPSGTLLEATTITMTPIESMEGLPTSGGLAAAVEFQPDGLILYAPATLTINFAESIPLDQQIPIGVSGDEHNLEVAFADAQGGSLRLQLLHFSSAGVAKGTLADLEPVRQRLGGDVEARLRSIAARELTDVLQRQRAGDETAVLSAEFVDWYVRTFREHVLNPRLAAARESCAAGRLALLTYVEFQRSLQLLGHSQAAEGFEQEILALIPDIVRQCIQEEYELCRDDHIVHHILLAITEIERQIQLMGLEGAGIESAMAEARQLAAKCLRFELKFESEVYGSVSTLQDTTSVMSATVLLLYDPNRGQITGEGPLVNSTFEIGGFRTPGMSCTGTGIPSPNGTLAVTGLGFVVQHNGPDDLLGYVADVILGYEDNPGGGISREGFTSTCTALGITTSMDATDLGFWSTGFQGAHMSEVVVGETAVPGLYNAKGWTVEGGDLFAELEWDRSGLAEMTEKGFFQLYHRPE